MMKPREHLTDGRERKSKEGNWKCLIRDVIKPKFLLKWTFIHWLSHFTTFTACLPYAQELVRIGNKIFHKENILPALLRVCIKERKCVSVRKWVKVWTVLSWTICEHKQTRQENRGFLETNRKGGKNGKLKKKQGYRNRRRSRRNLSPNYKGLKVFHDMLW